MDGSIFTLHRGTAPLLVSLPHDGTAVPDDITARLTPEARKVPDTDWWVSRLYAFAKDLGASVLVPRFSRYVIDLNRPPDDVSLYPGQNTTGLCPMVQFSGTPVYVEDGAPDGVEIAQRVKTYWRPYHQALQDELKRLREQHGRVVLWEGHSIRGEVPFLFEGSLPDFNLGTSGGASCRGELQQRLENVLEAQAGYSHIVNGRFKGGYITRHYADPGNGIDAVQLELAQRTYMDEQRVEWDDHKAQRLQRVLQALLETALG
ncbi:N-formylglutamate deformylase [Solilutibacter silvestris]|uniref:N-formylglutamate deformylase n=1 Tax=Solilutibacter silvestris TaxID=1645665 RepID=A0A2K1Q3N2_9GAMM|nr:N-formylglutamate deformylase [Lysobacter silvestris]PNS09660.1 N-formylglutamate deformylase [Lysobacter silvestris]